MKVGISLTALVIVALVASSAAAGHRCRGCGIPGTGGSYGGYYATRAQLGYPVSSVTAYPAAVATMPGYPRTYAAGYPSGIYAYRAAYGYGYYRPYGTYYGPGYTSYSYGNFPSAYAPGYLPPRYYGGVGYWGGRGSGYYYGYGPR